MSDQPLLPDPCESLVPTRNGAAHLPGRPTYLEGSSPVVLDGEAPPLWLEYWQTLRRHKVAIAVIALLGLLAGLALTLPQTPVYEARTTLEIQNLNENFLNMHELSPTADEATADPLQIDLQTQIKILQSESVLQQVIAKLHLTTRLPAQQEKSRFAAWRRALHLPDPKPASTQDILLQVTRNLKVSAQTNTRLVEILYDSTDPRLAADVANALTTEFVHQNLESRWQTTQKTGEWLTGQMEDVRIKLEKSERGLQNYARRAGLLFTSEKDNVDDEKLRQLQEELSKAQADRVMSQSKYEVTTKVSPDSLPEMLDDPTLKDYQLKLTDLHRQLAELSATLTPAHPSVQKVRAQVLTMEAAVEKQRANVTARIRNEFESSQNREKLLAASYDAQARVMTEQAEKVSHYNILKREVDNNRQIYDTMLQHVREAGIASALHASNVRVVDPAVPPQKPYKPSLALNSTLGLFAGGFFGIVFVVMRERSDQSIQSPGEASLYLAVPELGVIPSARSASNHSFEFYRRARVVLTVKTPHPGSKIPVELTISQKQPSVLGESFRSALTSLLYIGENGNGPRVIALTSANPQEGKTTVACNLALAFAEIGRRVLLIDADMRRPRLHEIFKTANAWGLSDLLEGKEPPEGFDAIVVETDYPGLYLLPAGSAPSSISNLLHSPRVLELLTKTRREFDIVIIDTPPMLQMPDARVVGRLADGVVLVVRSARTSKEDATAASQRLAEDGTRVLGTVLNDWDPRKTNHYSYEYVYRTN